MLDRQIDMVPWKTKQDYTITWSIGTAAPPVHLNMSDLLPSVWNGDGKMMKQLKAAWVAFDIEYPLLKSAPKVKKARKKKENLPGQVNQLIL